MTELLTAAQMRAIETAAIQSGAVTGLELMERAGSGVVEAVFEEWPELGQGAHRAVVLCGPGNNGGDGFVVARLLKERGWEVEVFLYGDAEKLPPDAKMNYERWAEMGEVTALGFPVVTALAFESLWARILARGYGEESLPDAPAPLVIDAIFGTGLTRPASGIASLFDLCSDSSPYQWGGATRWVAVDIPSGLCADSGRLYRTGRTATRIDQVLSADLTVTFHREKLGHRLAGGPESCGHVVVKPIGLLELDNPQDLDDDLADKGLGRVATLSGPLHPYCLAKKTGHKFSHGHALILSGGAGKTGAARLAARGALRIGAGLVTLGVPPSAQMEVASQITALMLTRVADADGLAEVLRDERMNALCLGPGLGLERARDLVPVALGNGGQIAHPTGVVLDADALSAFQDDPQTLFDMLHENCVLTPHGGEFARLFPDISERLNAPATKGPAYSKVDATRDAAKRAGCTVLFKGPDTVIADPSWRCSINAAVYDREAPWLATAGSGDVLAGFITGLLARGFAPMQAAETAAWLHVECARSFGPGLIAEDLPEELPKVFRALNL
ncbi:NAD(P)H-hydrate dehydratase [Primorskyibacter aestuariivivens]|uniref:NAD(P)H-hydrate dehydratase n=1 Tax=Primorskyibacter aestuariivivens TaxID=1888912 RepID=UPI0022FFD04C|nr:NAD(P)H-hydrate dehydratase [Primorskyibacter aestuariivivens]MDA7426896.1 NAD(P)H-hydrate dehydratase [Primorskyibacter aestuariivivens]